jgi:23S rRNA pseudouridine1911/1915/1917 synthase
VSVLSIEPNERITYGVAFEDEHLLVVEKPARVVTLPGKGHDTDSLLNGLFARHAGELQNLGKQRDFGLLHRLDKDASGLLIIARTVEAYDKLRASFESGDIRKYYWALVRGSPNRPKGLIKKPILEETSVKKLARVSQAGKPAVTAYRVLQSAAAGSLLECRTITGRLHQLRVHLKSISCPIYGDRFYAPDPVARGAPRLALHAHRIAFSHPITDRPIDVQTKWPADLRATLRRLELRRPDLAVGHPTHSSEPETG